MIETTVVAIFLVTMLSTMIRNLPNIRENKLCDVASINVSRIVQFDCLLSVKGTITIEKLYVHFTNKSANFYIASLLN